MVTQGCEAAQPPVRLSRVLKALGIARSVWYARPKEQRQRPGRKPRPVPEALAATIRELARRYPWWGYKRIAVVARRQGLAVSNKVVYRVFKAPDLLQKPRVRQAAERAVAGGRNVSAHTGPRLVVRSHGQVPHWHRVKCGPAPKFPSDVQETPSACWPPSPVQQLEGQLIVMARYQAGLGY
ncbi:MAG: IS3 family transposase [Gammaproteobacteria bacterium]|jgi:hypothetical protein